ncbi:MOSC domain-containing protein [Aeromicrobium ginsengisoli]|uniref:MOSC domain-containing protein n=1 Tax=Aeromicrobium ginsengisoli TaxID=363867 RepID=A0A5M4FJ19_9ACTN|nr:MOSC domain-containing protein [Aeromicrobium ginsengisoli]KAA1399958.1 MOSC domain-containing protein [Aeromicrobium ginsengisoli]
MSFVESVNTGSTVDVPWGQLKRSAIDKRPAQGAVHVHPLGVGDDEIADLKHHGGPDQAVYAYAREDLDAWERILGRELRAGLFGENLTTQGIDLNAARAGERWRIGGTLLELSGVRIPCSVFQGFVDEPQWVKRFTLEGRPGAYFRVLEPGAVQAGDRIEVVEHRTHDVTVDLLFRALTTERHLIPLLADEPRLDSFVARRLGARNNNTAT